MNTTEAKVRLEEELSLIERQLSELGTKNPATGEWETNVGAFDASATESDEIADRHEDLEERQDETAILTTRRATILAAIEALDKGTYGTCAVCGSPIEEERLAINPAALTCSQHA